MSFIGYHNRPVSIDKGSREVWLPHETGASLTTRDHRDEFKQVTMADLMTETNYLNPDVEVIAGINTPESFETLTEVLHRPQRHRHQPRWHWQILKFKYGYGTNPGDGQHQHGRF